MTRIIVPIAGVLLISTGLLTGCGAGNNGQTLTPQHANSSTPADGSGTSRHSQASSTRPLHTSLTWTQEGMPQAAVATLYRSSNQPFSMYTLPDYQASAEEPGKDVVLMTRNQAAWMRIEMYPATMAVSRIESSIRRALAVTATPMREKPGYAPTLPAATVFHAASAKSSVTAVLFERGGHRVVATVFVPAEFESLAPFFVMLKTIRSVPSPHR